MNKLFKDHLKQLYSVRLLRRDQVLTPSWKYQEVQCDSSLSTDRNSMAVHLTRSDCDDDDVLWNDSEENGNVSGK